MKKKNPPKKKKIEPPQMIAIEPEKKFDFGGLPDRDLKKNLGCG